MSSQQLPQGSPRPDKANVNGFPEYLKHTDLMADNNGQVKLTGRNTLFHAVLKGQVRHVRLLLERGLSANSHNDYGYSVLTAALHVDDDRRRCKLFRLLLKRGADPHVKDDWCHRSAIHWACLLGRTKEVRTLLNEVYGDFDLQDKDKDSLTALHLAVIAGHLDIVQQLVEVHRKLGVSVDLADNMGLTPYLHAKRMGFRDIAEYLHGQGQACVGHADRLFRTPREWSQIGKFERQASERIQALEAINAAKIQGRLSQARYLEHHGYPQPDPGPGASPRLPFTTPSPRRPAGFQAAHRRDRGYRADPLSISLPSLQEHRLQGYHRPHSANGHSPGFGDYMTSDINARLTDFQMRPHREAFGATVSDSTDTGSGLPGQSGEPGPNTGTPGMGNIEAFHLMEMHEKGRHARTYRHSQFDKTKASEYKHMLGNLMEVLAEQQSSSFRKSVRYQKPETPKKIKPKNKVSTLAVIFGRDKSGRRSRKTKSIDRSRSPKVSASKSKGEKTASRKEKEASEVAKKGEKSPSPRKDKGVNSLLSSDDTAAVTSKSPEHVTSEPEPTARRRKIVPLLKVNDKVI